MWISPLCEVSHLCIFELLEYGCVLQFNHHHLSVIIHDLQKMCYCIGCIERYVCIFFFVYFAGFGAFLGVSLWSGLMGNSAQGVKSVKWAQIKKIIIHGATMLDHQNRQIKMKTRWKHTGWCKKHCGMASTLRDRWVQLPLLDLTWLSLYHCRLYVALCHSWDSTSEPVFKTRGYGGGFTSVFARDVKVQTHQKTEDTLGMHAEEREICD